MQPREAFRLGFLLRCAEEGLTPEQTQVRVMTLDQVTTKQAGWTEWIPGADLVGKGVGLATGLGLMAPPALGYAGGYLGAKATEPNIDAEDIKRQEMIQEFRRLALQARRQQKRRLRSGL